MMKNALLMVLMLTIAVMTSSLIPSQTEAVLINGSFEAGFTSWTKYIPSGGNAWVVTQYLDSIINYYPVEGSYFAKLKTDGPGSYTTLSQSIFLNTGDVLSGWAAFDANDYLPFNDNAWVKIYNSIGALVVTPWYDSVSEVGNHGNSNWTYWEWAATTSDTYTLKLGIANGGDYGWDSYALFDANCHTPFCTPVPEPGSMLLFGTGLIGLIGIGRRRFFS